jgi:ribosomal protein L11 methyltransferase
MRWLALSVEADVEAVEAVSEILGRLGHGSAVEPLRLVADEADEQALRPDPAAGFRVTTWVPDDETAADSVARTETALGHLRAFDLRPMSGLTVTAVDDADWATGWRSGYAPIRLGRLSLVPTWLEVPPDAELVIRLDPGMAFGTGLHPTTRGCLELLQRLGPMPAEVLDVGTGSGILGLGALRLGARRVVGYDVDRLAVEAATANAAANDLGAQFEARLGTLPEDVLRPYPLVLANLVAAVLVELAPRLAAHTAPGGTLIASGIIDTRADEVDAALVASGFVVEERLVDGDWITLRARRAP